MFLKQLIEHNPALVDYAITLHQQGDILPDSYVLDVDQIMDNGALLLQEARKNNLKCLYMSKQIGRNPEICKRLEALGFDGAVAVDFKEALHLAHHGLKLYNVGHLVQVPNSVLEKLMIYGVEYITVYSYEKVALINEIAKKLNINQKIIVKVLNDTCLVYDGQQGGFDIDELQLIVEQTSLLKHVSITGVTSFPCLIYNSKTKQVDRTPNFDLVLEANTKLQELGCLIDEVNIPSANISVTMEKIAQAGGTTVEPGHGLTGTTPYHVDYFDHEQIAMCYVSEISHHYHGQSFAYGGGYYRRSNISNALIVDDSKRTMGHISGPSEENIDYYFKLDQPYPIGSTVIASFRTQIFTTRSHVVLVTGLKRGEPKILGMYDSLGRVL
jgi:predicted amino acid racemase